MDLSSIYNDYLPAEPVLDPWGYTDPESFDENDFRLMSSLAMISPARSANKLLSLLTADDLVDLERSYVRAEQIAQRQARALMPDVAPRHLNGLATYIDRRRQGLTSAPLMASLIVSSVGDIRDASERGDHAEAARLRQQLTDNQQLLVGLDLIAGLDESAAALHAIPARARLGGLRAGAEALQDVGKSAVRRPLLGLGAVGLTSVLSQFL